MVTLCGLWIIYFIKPAKRFHVTGKYVSLDLEFPDGFQRYKIAYTNTFGKPPWFDAVAQEYAACREAIGLSDYSSFTKIDLWVIYYYTFSNICTNYKIFKLYDKKVIVQFLLSTIFFSRTIWKSWICCSTCARTTWTYP